MGVLGRLFFLNVFLAFSLFLISCGPETCKNKLEKDRISCLNVNQQEEQRICRDRAIDNYKVCKKLEISGSGYSSNTSGY